jgi:hypothetical protein
MIASIVSNAGKSAMLQEVLETANHAKINSDSAK